MNQLDMFKNRSSFLENKQNNSDNRVLELQSDLEKQKRYNNEKNIELENLRMKIDRYDMQIKEERNEQQNLRDLIDSLKQQL